MANENNKIKLLLLWDILSKNTDENHAMNADEIREELAKRGISVMRKVIADDIAVLNEYGYEVLSYKKKYYYYYVVSRPIETAEVVMLADAVNASKLPATQKKALVERLSSFLCSHQAESVSKHIISFEKSRKGSSSLIYNVDSIERAINENKKISFLYFDYDDKHKKVYRKEGKRYVVSPAYMVWNKDNYYLLCFSNGYADLVTYRLDKMDDVKVDETDGNASSSISCISQSDKTDFLIPQFYQRSIPKTEILVIGPTAFVDFFRMMLYLLADIKNVRKYHLCNGSCAICRDISYNNTTFFGCCRIHYVVSRSKHTDILQFGQGSHVIGVDDYFIRQNHFSSGCAFQYFFGGSTVINGTFSESFQTFP